MELYPWLRNLPPHWRVAKLGYVAKISTGTADVQDSFDDGEYPFFIRSPKVKRLPYFTHDTEAILTAGDGNVGDIFHHFKGKFVAHQRVYIIEPGPLLYGRYLYYVMMQTFKDSLGGNTAKSTVESLRRPMLTSFQIPLPPLEEQRKIADELDRELAKIDELIADQLRLQDLLQERLVSLTFELATDASNPDRYETGHPFWKTLPKGWTLQKLGWHFKIGNGSTPLSTNESYWSDDSTQIPWFNSSTVNQDLATIPARYVTELAVKDCHLPIVPKGSLLMGMIGQGKTRGRVTKTGIDATLSQNIAYLTPRQNSKVKVDFAKLALEAAYPELREINSGNGTTKGSLSCENIQQFKIPIPPKGHQSEIIILHTETYNEIQFLIAKLKKSRLLFTSKKISIINSFLRIDN